MNKDKNNPKGPKAAPMYQNYVRLVGFLGGKPMEFENRAVFSLATKTSWKAKDSDKWESHTEWHHCVAWGKLSEAIRSLAKSDYLLVEGELRSSAYLAELLVVGEGTATVPVTSWEIRAFAVRTLDRKKSAKKPQKAAA